MLTTGIDTAQDQGEERAGGARGDPPDGPGADARLAAPGAGGRRVAPVRPHLAAHPGVPDDRRSSAPGQQLNGITSQCRFAIQLT